MDIATTTGVRSVRWRGRAAAGSAVLACLWLVGCGSAEHRAAFEEYERAARVRPAGRALAAAPAPRAATTTPAPTAPQTAPTLQDYLRRAALRNPGLEAAFDRWKAALERVPQVTALPDPRFTYAYYIERVETRVGPQRQQVALAQTFPWFGKLRLRGDAAAADARAAQQEFERTKQRLFFRVKEAYYELYYVGRAIEVTRETADLMGYFEKIARSRYRVAAAEHADVIRAQVEFGKLQDELQALHGQRTPLAAKLNAALNRPADTPVPLPTAIEYQPVTASDDRLLTWMDEASPELGSLRCRVEGQRAKADLARKTRFPDVTLGLGYIDTGPARGPASDSGKDPVVGTVSINVPMWPRKYRAAERQARAELRSAQRSVEDAANALAADVKLALFRLRDAERKTNLYRDTLIPKARQSLKATEAAYTAGKASLLDLLDAEATRLAFRLLYERVHTDHALRVAELEMLIGRPLPSPAGP